MYGGYAENNDWDMESNVNAKIFLAVCLPVSVYCVLMFAYVYKEVMTSMTFLLLVQRLRLL